jgi:acyl-CoA reductase-like NAD-dependent aldehyde dehydrogenase
MATVDLARQQLLIGGNWTDAGSGGSYEQRFPYDGTAVATAAAAGREDARAAVDAAHAAQTLSGGEPGGALFPPTVITGVTSEMRVYSEESFGPLASIISVDGPDEAVRVANDTEYGLSAAVFSQNVQFALELAQRIESGICHVNDTTVQDEPQMPFGGVKASGFGRFGGRAALEEFTELGWITVQELARQYPI